MRKQIALTPGTYDVASIETGRTGRGQDRRDPGVEGRGLRACAADLMGPGAGPSRGARLAAELCPRVAAATSR